MFLDNFNYDAKGASIILDLEKTINNGTIHKTVLSNGVEFVYTIFKDQSGFSSLDTNYILVKQPNGFYYSDLNEPKIDYRDYFSNE